MLKNDMRLGMNVSCRYLEACRGVSWHSQSCEMKNHQEANLYANLRIK